MAFGFSVTTMPPFALVKRTSDSVSAYFLRQKSSKFWPETRLLNFALLC